MKIWTRITLITSVVVAVALAVYAAVELGRNRSERRLMLEREVRDAAVMVRTAVEAESRNLSVERAESLSRELASNPVGIPVRVLSREALGQARSEGSGQGPALDRLETMVEVRPEALRTVHDKTLIYTVPVRAPDAAADGGYRIVGAVEAQGSLAPLASAWRGDLLRILPVFAVILGLMVAAILVFTRRLVTRPIEKLVAGMDDVAGGDLSRVLLSEREDEVGALAARFNEMTASLRESREESARQSDARLSLEAQLSQTEKLATIGQLAAEIAHEVGTPLGVIAGRARNLARKAEDPEAVAKNANIIAEQATRITKIIQRLLDFARRKVGTVEPEVVNLNQVTLTTMDFLDSKIKGAKVHSRLSREEGLPMVKGHPDQLQQVLINLLLNAVEAMGEGGRLEVETYSVTRRRPGLEMAPEQTYAVVAIRDSGPGISAEHREKIFEPFYTSKDGQGGTGLGLAVSFGIIKDHDGWIEVDDAEGGGTVFRIVVPRADAAVASRAPSGLSASEGRAP